MDLVMVVVVLVSVTMVKPEALPPQDNLTTVDGVVRQWFLYHVLELNQLQENISDIYGKINDLTSSNQTSQLDTFILNIFDYTVELIYSVALELIFDLENVTTQSIYDDLKGHCYEYLEKRIQDINEELTNTTCVANRLLEMLRINTTRAIKVALQKVSRDCDQQQLTFCLAEHRNCTRPYEERFGQLLTSHIQHLYDLQSIFELTLLDILDPEADLNMLPLAEMLHSFELFLSFADLLTDDYNVTKPFGFKNVLRLLTNINILEFNSVGGQTTSKDDLSWGIIRSHTGIVKGVCSHYSESYWLNSDNFPYISLCYALNILQVTGELMLCDFKYSTAETLTWSTAPSLYFHSECLCVAFNGHDCGLEEHHVDNYLFYCFSVLFRDFQKQVAFRPAVTYLDYAFQTRVPVCIFSEFLLTSFKSICPNYQSLEDYNFSNFVGCYFNTLLNKNLNCSETLIFDPHNHTMLCSAAAFVLLVDCDDAVGNEFRIPYYRAGDSLLVLFLTYGDVAVRVLTVVTYLACPQLRNLPGKLLISYLMTVLLRLIVVQATLADMALAVRLDVAMDLSSVFWLTSYLHFLTVSITELRPPNSLSRDEACMLFFRYSLLGWVLPAALSASFFWIDEAIECRVQIGQLLFVLCYYVALLANFYMFFINCNFYFDIRNNVRGLLPGVTARRVFADLLNFALKTLVLSGAGISFRLIFTQIQGLAGLLGYYHAAGTLQGLLLFLLYGCNREARVFWFNVLRSTLSRCIHRRQNIFVRRNFLELNQNPSSTNSSQLYTPSGNSPWPPSCHPQLCPST